MTLLCEGRVAIVTGAARGVGREHALLLAKHGAKVVVNDLGGAVDGTGADTSPAQQVADEIKAMGGEAVVNGDDVGSFDGAKAMIDQAINTFGDLNILVNNAGILRDRTFVDMTRTRRTGMRSFDVHLTGSLCANPSRRRIVAQAMVGARRRSRSWPGHRHQLDERVLYRQLLVRATMAPLKRESPRSRLSPHAN